jgi:hypothetical protein
MAALTTIAAIGALVVGAASYVSAEKNRKEAQANYAAQAAEQGKARQEERALNAQAAANERRQQIREERVRRARLLQSAENTGTEGSSGQLGAEGGFATQLGAAIGSNLGRLAGAERITQLGQSAANFGSAAQSSLSSMQANQNLFGLSTTIFSAAYSPKGKPVPSGTPAPA